MYVASIGEYIIVIMDKRFYYLKVFLILESVLIVFLGIFYFSCGQSLYIRQSDGNIAEFNPTNDVGELVEGRTIKQIYTSQMDSIGSVAVMASNYGQQLNSELRIYCENITAGQLITDQTFLTKDIGVNQYIYLDIPDNIPVMRGDTIQITCTSTGLTGNAPTILYSVEDVLKNKDVAAGSKLFIDEVEVPGTMCIAVQGYNYVWTGPNYWKLVLVALVLLTIFYWLEVIIAQRGRNTLLFGGIHVFNKYRFLIKQLVQRDFKVRYKRSVLGVFWSFLNPLLMMIVQYVVFSQLFKSDIDNYPVYLLCGLVVFNFFNEGVSVALSSIVGNASLITKVYIPKYIYPVTRVLSSGINLLMSLIPLAIAALITGEKITKAYLMLPYILICVAIFTIGFGMILAAAMTFFRDIQFLWGIVSMIWMYLTPLFYPISIVPDELSTVITNNPMYYFVSAVRNIVMEGVTPRPVVFFQCTMAAIVMLIIGCVIFKKTQDKFVFYI